VRVQFVLVFWGLEHGFGTSLSPVKEKLLVAASFSLFLVLRVSLFLLLPSVLWGFWFIAGLVCVVCVGLSLWKAVRLLTVEEIQGKGLVVLSWALFLFQLVVLFVWLYRWAWYIPPDVLHQYVELVQPDVRSPGEIQATLERGSVPLWGTVGKCVASVVLLASVAYLGYLFFGGIFPGDFPGDEGVAAAGAGEEARRQV
jgi:hypothetical protein